jgi:hypothetical protein
MILYFLMNFLSFKNNDLFRGPEIINILEEIKITFRKSIDKIR